MSVIDDEAMKWTLQRVERELDDGERAAFQAWYDADVRHRGAYVRALAIHTAVSRATVQDNLRPTAARLALPELEHAHEHEHQPDHDPERQAGAAPGQVLAPARAPGMANVHALPPSPRRSGRRRFLAFGAMAAGVAALGFGARLLAPADQPPLVLATAKGEFRKVPLADQSLASINSASRIEVLYTGHARQVTLAAGEAWFQVAKDKSKPFTVAAGPVRAQAVGTAFAVRRHGDGAEVLVTEGSVAVWSGAGGQRHLLAAGESAMVSGNAVTVTRSAAEVQRRLAWREGKLVFKNQSLKDAVADFNRYSAKPIVIADPRLAGKTLIGQYRTDAPERFARDVSASFNVPYSVTEKEILIGRPS